MVDDKSIFEGTLSYFIIPGFCIALWIYLWNFLGNFLSKAKEKSGENSREFEFAKIIQLLLSAITFVVLGQAFREIYSTYLGGDFTIRHRNSLWMLILTGECEVFMMNRSYV